MADDAGRLNAVLAETSFLYGGNAGFVEDLYAQWALDPTAVEPSWRAFFASLADTAATVEAAAQLPSWTPPPTPQSRPDWLSTLDGLWPAVDAKLERKLAAVAPAASSIVRGPEINALFGPVTSIGTKTTFCIWSTSSR